MAIRGLELYGTCPEAIKMAPVIERLRQADFKMTVVNSGQHDPMMPNIITCAVKLRRLGRRYKALP